MNSELRAVEEEHEELTRKMQQPQHTVEHASKRLAVLNSVRGQRLAKAREVSKRQRLAEFDEYVRENANYFVKPVLGPILTLMECADQTHRNMLSQSIANNVFGAYVTQTKADYDKVSATARAMRCDVFLVEKSVWSEPDVSHLRELGVTHRLDQTFDAPAVIKTVLCNVSSLHKAYALKSMPGAQVERIVKTTEVRRAFTPDTAYASSTSRYDASAVAITVRDLRVSNTFQGGVDERERGELEKRVEGARREVAALAKTKGVIQERRKRLETEIERVAARQKNLAAIASSVREEIRRLDGAVASARGYLERDSRATDVDKIERETKRDASASLKKRVKTALEAAAVTAEAAEKTHELTTRALRCKELHVQYEYFKDEWNTASETNNRLRDELRPSEERLRTLKQTARDLRVPAMEATNGRDPGKDAALEAKFAQWDDDLAILEESVRMIEDEADAIMCPTRLFWRTTGAPAAGGDHRSRAGGPGAIARRVRGGDRRPARGVDAQAASAGGDHQRELQTELRRHRVRGGGSAPRGPSRRPAGSVEARDLGQVPRGDGHAHPGRAPPERRRAQRLDDAVSDFSAGADARAVPRG